MTRPVKMLSGLSTLELTLTKRGANGRRFAITKSYGGITMEPEVIQALLETPAEGEDKLVETLKSANLSEEKIAAAVASFRVQKGLKDLVADDVFQSVSKAAGYIAEPTKAEPVKKTLDLSKLEPEMRNQIEAVFKSNQDMAKKTQELESVVKSLQTDGRRKEFVAKAEKEFSFVPMAAAALGDLLMKAHEQNEELGKSLEGVLKSVQESVKLSGSLNTIGGNSVTSASGAWGKIEALADGMVKKSVEGGKGMSKHQAIDLVLKTDEGRALYQDYLNEKK